MEFVQFGQYWKSVVLWKYNDIYFYSTKENILLKR